MYPPLIAWTMLVGAACTTTTVSFEQCSQIVFIWTPEAIVFDDWLRSPQRRLVSTAFVERLGFDTTLTLA